MDRGADVNWMAFFEEFSNFPGWQWIPNTRAREEVGGVNLAWFEGGVRLIATSQIISRILSCVLVTHFPLNHFRSLVVQLLFLPGLTIKVERRKTSRSASISR